MSRTDRRSIVARCAQGLAAVAVLAALAAGQAPDPGDYYVDKVELGFKLKMPKGWDFTPPQPNEKQLIGKYTPPFTKYINIGPDEILFLEAFLVKFDRRAAAPTTGIEATGGEGEREREKPYDGAAALQTWLEREMRYGKGFRVAESDETRVGKVDATEYVFTATGDGGIEFNVYAMTYRIAAEVDVAVVFDGPADKRKWRKYETAFKRMAKSFRPVEVEQVEYSGPREGDSAYRSKKRAELEAEVAKNPGWELYETPNYFVISNVDDREFLDELKDRLEAIRAIYEQMYPWEQAERLRAKAKEGQEAADDEAAEDAGAQGPRTTTKTSSRELSRCSVVRVCASENEYHEYGGPGGSAGYWASFHEELVLYDDKAGGGRRDTWAVLNHEAFHQYIFYLYGNLAPHSWYNEGHGDFFSGHQYRHKKFVLKPFDWRERTIQMAIREKKHVPLKDLVRWTQAQYYGSNDLGVGGGQNYAQGWSLVYFLRTGPQKARVWNDDWDGILDVYFATLASTGDLDQAVDTAFAGVDWDELEAAWIDYTLRG